jgi:hypothetical protein
MLRSLLLPDLEGSLIKGFSFGILALLKIKFRKVTGRISDIRMRDP